MINHLFFNGVADYSNQLKFVSGYEGQQQISSEWAYHPLNWHCEDHPKCFKKAELAQEFFAKTLEPLEAHYGNCTKTIPDSKFTWICPSKENSKDSLTFNTNVNTLSFDSTKGSAKCWVEPEGPASPYSSSDKDKRSFTCEAYNSLNGKDPVLHFQLHAYAEDHYPSVWEYGASYTGKISNVGFQYIDKTKEEYKKHNSQFIQFLLKSNNLQNWQDNKRSGLLQAFVAATKSEPSLSSQSSPTSQSVSNNELLTYPECPTITCPTPEPLVCPAPPTVTCPTPQPIVIPESRNDQFAIGLIAGVVGTMLLLSLKNRLTSRKKEETPSSPLNTHIKPPQAE